MKLLIKFSSLLLAALTALPAFGQAKKPTLMAVPDMTWCTANGYVIESDYQGRHLSSPDYEKALANDFDMASVLTKLNELMAERGFPMRDLASMIGDLNRNEMEDEMTTSRTSGAELGETPLERLQRRAKADIILNVGWKVNNMGPKRSITYLLKGVDAYTNEAIASAQGTGAASFSAEIPVLLQEAVLENMDQFESQLQAHFDDMAANGRKVNIRLQVFDNGSGLSFEDDYDGEELAEIIENWVAENSVSHRYTLEDSSENFMDFEGVRIPLYNEKGRPMDARMYARKLQKFLAASPYNITCKIKAGGGLGRATLILGEK